MILRTVATSLFAKHLHLTELLLSDSDQRFQIHAANDGAGEIGIREIGTGQDCGREVDAREVGTGEVGSREIGADERRLFEVCPDELGTGQVGHTEIDEIKFEIGEIEPNQIGKLALQNLDAHMIRGRNSCYRGHGGR